MRSQELALTQTRNNNLRDLNQAETDLAKARRQYDLYKPLVGTRVRLDEDLQRYPRRPEYQAQATANPQAERRPDRSAANEPAGAAARGLGSLNSSMGIARSNLGQLSIRAPVTGELSGFDIQLGQSLQQGERIGQIDSAGGNKLQADVDEYYLGRVRVGQTATADLDGKTYRLKVAKVYPQVRNGQFQIDLIFDGPAPASVQRGQTRPDQADARRSVESAC